eukprot:TRINITY_DN233_c0_g2_i1.p1 TRINITY_DN233_c0_g2~~TRINITY_DN233_c0_g2_i1.p1  ORF type:complete len:194 (+),score=6.94 TRINITY_DN233_c0_g2_i1:123-704(+)
MGSLAKQMALCHHTQRVAPPHKNHHRNRAPPAVQSHFVEEKSIRRRSIVATLLATSTALGLQGTPIALGENWGTKSFLKERFFEPELSPEDAVARIRQTAEGLHDMRHMLDTMSWRYVIFYIRLKSAYLSSDLNNALKTLPENRRKSYVETANELVDNMGELDYYVRTPKIYESYVYYEKTLKSMDELVALLA